MSEFFLTIINMSISASWIVLAVVLLRLLIKKAPKWITVLLWGIVAVRLICPFTIESVMSLIPSVETISPEIMMDATPEINSGIPILNNTINPVISESFATDPVTSANPLQILIPVLSVIWVIGIAGMLLYTVVSYFRIKRKIDTAVLLRDNVFQSENVVSPFVLGIIKPKVYLPFSINEPDMSHVIAHEQAHISRKDHFWKPIGFLLLTIHWFNPLMWLGYILLCRDIELACDEKVIKELNTEQKADYSQALLTCSVNRRMFAACPLAFGEVGVKNRVKSVLNYKKPAFWIIVIAIIASIVVAVCFLTNPATNSLENIEFLNFEERKQNTVSVLVSDGETYTPVGVVNQDLLNELCGIKISKNEISLNRGEDRDKTHTLVLQTAKDTEPTIYSYVEGLHIHFNSTFTSVWVNNSVKPTLSYRVINPLKAKQIYEDIANFAGAEKLTWTYQPMLSFTGHSFRAFSFDFEYTHVEATCTAGEFCSLDVEGQPRGTKLRFENGTKVYWTPEEAVIEKISQKSEVTMEIYNDKTQVHKCTVVFECVSRDTASAVFEIYLKVPDGLQMVESNGILLVEQSSISNIGGADGPDNVTVNSGDSTGIHYPANQGLYEVTPTDEIQSKYDNEEFIIQKLHYKAKDGTWACENHTYKYRLEISGRLNNADKNTTYIVLSNSKDITFEQTWKASGLSSLMSDYFNPKDAVIVGHRLFSATSTKGNLETAILSVLNEKYNKAGKPDGLLHIENYYLLANETASGTPLKDNSGHMQIANVYLLVYHMKYSVNGDQLEEVEGDFVPTAITFSIDENGQYTLKEYWTPRNDENYEKDVRSKFPGSSATEALNTDKYAEELIKENWRLANEAFSITNI